MNTNAHSAHSVSICEKAVAQKEAELEAAQDRVRQSLRDETLLAERPDLLEARLLAGRHKEQQIRVANLSDQYRRKKSKLIEERKRTYPFQLRSEMLAELDYLNWLLEAVRASESGLEALLNDVRLQDQDRSFILRRLDSNRQPWVPLHALFSRSWNRVSQEDASLVYTNLDWNQHIEARQAELTKLSAERDKLKVEYDYEVEQIVDQSLSSLRNELEIAKIELAKCDKAQHKSTEVKAYLVARIDREVNGKTQAEREALNEARRELREARLAEENRKEAAERAWWHGLSERPVSELASRLSGLSGQRADAALERILRMRADDSHLHDRRVQEFLRNVCHSRAGSPALLSPAIIALLGRLSLETPEEARRLRTMLPGEVGQEFAPVVGYLDFMLAERPELTGVTRYDSLGEVDLYLGACYWEQGSEVFGGLSNWDFHSVKDTLRQFSEYGKKKAINSFKVEGLQPRVAELAFREVYRRLKGVATLRDLNAETIERLPRPWRLSSNPTLPGADWRDESGIECDVKCNLYYRSKKAKEGLRGLYVGIKDLTDVNHHYPGFVFFDSDDQCCSWCYIGTYRPKDKIEGERVNPFLFRLPKICRFEAQPSEVAENLLADGPLRLGWRLASRTTPRSPFGNSLLDQVVTRCASRPESMPLEEALWRYITEAVLHDCSTLGQDHVNDFLQEMATLVCSRALPLYLPRLGGEPLLERWIDDVLRPIVNHWTQIRCPVCRLTGDAPGNIRLGDIRMTAEGSIDAKFECRSCGPRGDRVRVLTHCHKCTQYPLLIGANEVCPHCSGLICHGTSISGTDCLSCKRDSCQGYTDRKSTPKTLPANTPSPDNRNPPRTEDIGYEEIPF